MKVRVVYDQADTSEPGVFASCLGLLQESDDAHPKTTDRREILWQHVLMRRSTLTHDADHRHLKSKQSRILKLINSVCVLEEIDCQSEPTDDSQPGQTSELRSDHESLRFSASGATAHQTAARRPVRVGFCTGNGDRGEGDLQLVQHFARPIACIPTKLAHRLHIWPWSKVSAQIPEFAPRSPRPPQCRFPINFLVYHKHAHRVDRPAANLHRF